MNKIANLIEAKWRCTLCGSFTDDPLLIRLEGGRGYKDEWIEVCPTCKKGDLVEQEKVNTSAPVQLPKEVEEFRKFDEDQFANLISRLSPSNRLNAIKIIVNIFRKKDGDVHQLDETLWQLISHKSGKRQF